MATSDHDFRGDMKTSWFSVNRISTQSDIFVNQYKKHVRVVKVEGSEKTFLRKQP